MYDGVSCPLGVSSCIEVDTIGESGALQCITKRMLGASSNLLVFLMTSWTAVVFRYAGMTQADRTSISIMSVPLSTVRGWHRDTYRAFSSHVTTFAARGGQPVSSAKGILLQRHAASFLTNVALYLVS